MNNPALPVYASQGQNPYAAAAAAGFAHPQPGGFYTQSPGPPYDPAQTSFQPTMIPNHMQRPSHSQQIHQPIPQQFYQQPHQPSHPGFPHQGPASNAGSPFPGQTSSNRPSPAPLNPGSRHSSNPSIPQVLTPSSSQAAAAASVPTTADQNMAMAAAIGIQGQPNATLAQQAQMQNAAQAARGAPTPQHQQPQSSQQQHPQTGQAQGQPMSPQSAARERARVSVLLEINTHLLQEVVSLQAQGKAGATANQGQQSPTSPTSATDPTNALNNSPGEPPKSAGGPGTNSSKPASQEYADCMRRLQANLSYLAAIADAKKKVNGALPAGPAILAPPAHLTPVHDLYKRLNALFPEANHSAVNKAVGYASNLGQAQHSNAGVKQQHAAALLAHG